MLLLIFSVFHKHLIYPDPHNYTFIHHHIGRRKYKNMLLYIYIYKKHICYIIYIHIYILYNGPGSPRLPEPSVCWPLKILSLTSKRITNAQAALNRFFQTLRFHQQVNRSRTRYVLDYYPNKAKAESIFSSFHAKTMSQLWNPIFQAVQISAFDRS